MVAVPPSNDVDVFAQDLGFIAITGENDEVVGYDVAVGGGMGMTHGEPETFPRTADVMGFCRPEQAVDVAEKVVLVQRDYGDRSNRKHARLKYTIEDRGIDWFRAEVERRLGYALEAPRPFAFEHTGDRYGWVQDHEGNWHYTLFVQNGRVLDRPDRPMRTGLAEIARVHQGDFRLTANQNLMIARVRPRQKRRIEQLLAQYRLDNDHSGLRLNSLACVALPTCGLALAESERYLPDLVTALEEVILRAGLRDDDIVIRMTTVSPTVRRSGRGAERLDGVVGAAGAAAGDGELQPGVAAAAGVVEPSSSAARTASRPRRTRASRPLLGPRGARTPRLARFADRRGGGEWWASSASSSSPRSSASALRRSSSARRRPGIRSATARRTSSWVKRYASGRAGPPRPCRGERLVEGVEQGGANGPAIELESCRRRRRAPAARWSPGPPREPLVDDLAHGLRPAEPRRPPASCAIVLSISRRVRHSSVTRTLYRR